jgi:Tol biopolymer transport system component
MIKKYLIFLASSAALLLLLTSCGGSGTKIQGISEADIGADSTLMNLKMALDNNPENPSNYTELAVYLEDHGYDEGAIDIYRQGLEKWPNNNEFLYNLGRLQIKNGKEIDGYKNFRKVMSSVDAMSYVEKIGPYFMDVYVLQPVVYSSSDEAYPTVDSAKTYLYYQSNANGNWDIYRVPITGGTPEQLTTEESNEENPAISPDGKTLILVSDKDDERPVPYNQKLRDIYRYDIEKHKYINLTENFSNDYMPKFDKTGEEMVFVSERNDLREDATFIDKYSNIFSMEPSGKFQVSLTKGNYFDANPTYSVNKEVVYFDSNRKSQYQNIFKTNIETKEIEEILPEGEYNNFGPSVNADNTKMIYVSDRDGNYELYMYDFKAHKEERLTSSDAEDLNPIFIPNTNKILFHSNRSGSFDIYLLDLNSKNVTPTPYDILSQIDNKLITMGGTSQTGQQQDGE